MRIPRKIAQTAGKASVEQMTTLDPATAAAEAMAPYQAATKVVDAVSVFDEQMREAEDVAETANQENEYQRRRNELLSDERWDQQEIDGRPSAELLRGELVSLQGEFLGKTGNILSKGRRDAFKSQLESQFLDEQAGVDDTLRKQRIAITDGKLERAQRGAEDLDTGEGIRRAQHWLNMRRQMGTIGDEAFAINQSRISAAGKVIAENERAEELAAPGMLAVETGDIPGIEKEIEALAKITGDDRPSALKAISSLASNRSALITGRTEQKKQEKLYYERLKNDDLAALNDPTNPIPYDADQARKENRYGDNEGMYAQMELAQIRKEDSALQASFGVSEQMDVDAINQGDFLSDSELEDRITPKDQTGMTQYGHVDDQRTWARYNRVKVSRDKAVIDNLDNAGLETLYAAGMPFPDSVPKKQGAIWDRRFNAMDATQKMDFIKSTKWVPPSWGTYFNSSSKSPEHLGDAASLRAEIRKEAPTANTGLSEEQEMLYATVEDLAEAFDGDYNKAAAQALELQSGIDEQTMRDNRAARKAGDFTPDYVEDAGEILPDASMSDETEAKVGAYAQRQYEAHFDRYGSHTQADAYARTITARRWKVSDLNGVGTVMRNGPEGDIADSYRKQVAYHMQKDDAYVVYTNPETRKPEIDDRVDIDQITFGEPKNPGDPLPLMYQGGAATFAFKGEDGTPSLIQPMYRYDPRGDMQAEWVEQKRAAYARLDESKAALREANRLVARYPRFVPEGSRDLIERMEKRVAASEAAVEGLPSRTALERYDPEVQRLKQRQLKQAGY